MDELVKININIAERVYPMKVRPESERNLRTAAELINSLITKYKKAYAGKDLQDLLAMASLQIASELRENEDKNESGKIKEEISGIIQEINDFNIEIKRKIA